MDADAQAAGKTRAVSRCSTATACAFCVALAACAGGDGRSLQELRVTAADAPLIGQVVEMRPDCPTDPAASLRPESAPLIGAVAALGVDVALRAVDGALKAEVEAQSGQFLATGRIDAPDMQALGGGGCLVIYRGVLGPVAPDLAADPTALLTPAMLGDLGLADYPAFYLELEASRADDVLLLQPVHLHYAASVARSAGSGRKHVTVVVAMDPGAPTAAPEPAAEAVFGHNLGRITIGSTITDREGAFQFRGAAVGRVVADWSKGQNLAVLVTEAEEAPLALRALSAAFSSRRDKLLETIEGAVLSF